MIKNSAKFFHNFSIKYFENIVKQKNSLTSNNLSRKITTYKMSNYKYPEVRRDLSIVDDIHGTKASI